MIKKPLAFNRRTTLGKSCTNPIVSARSRTPSVPESGTFRPRAIVRPICSSIKSMSTCSASASRMACRSPRCNETGNVTAPVFVYCANLKPGGQRRHAATHIFWRSCIRQFLVHRNWHKNLLKQFPEQMLLFDGNQIAEWRSVGDGLHPACMLTRVAPRRRFE